MAQQLKVSNIEQTVGADGEPRWIVSFESKKLTASEKIEPKFKSGDMVNVQFHKPPTGQEGAWYYTIIHDEQVITQTKPKTQKQYTASPEKIESIELQNARNNAVALYCKTTDDGVVLDTEYLGKCFRAVEALGAENYLVKEAKKLGGKIKDD